MLKRKAVVIPVAVLVTAVAAFAGYGAYTRKDPVTYARGGNDFAVVEPEATASAPSPTSSVTPTPTPGASASPGVAPSISPDQPVTAPGSTSGPVPVANRQPSAVQGVVLPRVGSYGLKVDGSEKVDFGPLSFCSQKLPETTNLVVSKASGEGPTSFNLDLRYFPGEEGKHDERHLLRYDASSVHLDYEIATVTCQGVRQSSDTEFAPPQLRVKLPLQVGDAWNDKTGDADRTEDASTKVVGQEVLVIAGERVPTYRIQTQTRFTGSESGTREQTWWWAPSWALPVKWTERIEGGRSGASYQEQVTVTVTSRP